MIRYFVEVEGYAYTTNGGRGSHVYREKFDTIREGRQFLTDMQDEDKLSQYSRKHFEGEGYVQKVRPHLYKETIIVEKLDLESNNYLNDNKEFFMK